MFKDYRPCSRERSLILSAVIAWSFYRVSNPLYLYLLPKAGNYRTVCMAPAPFSCTGAFRELQTSEGEPFTHMPPEVETTK